MTQRHPVRNGVPMFITTNVRRMQPLFENPAYAREAIDTLYRVREMRPFSLYGFVIMYDHCHLLMRVEAPETISGIMHGFKRATCLNVGLGHIWQPRFYIKIVDNFSSVIRYIHMNPVAAGYCEKPEEYQWSSASGMWEVDPLP